MIADIVIIGAGIAGASLAYELAGRRRVVLLEREGMPGYHTTGRSAATFTESYGEAPVRLLATASRDFFTAPPAGFSEHPLLAARGLLFPAREDQLPALEAMLAEQSPTVVERIDGREAREMVPILRRDQVAAAVRVRGASDIDVHALHQGFLSRLKARDGRIMVDAEVTAIDRDGDAWRVTTRAGAVEAPIVVDAAGAWADDIARLAGVAPVGLVPKRRTAMIVDAPEGIDASAWPLVIDIDEQFYFKPEAGRLLASPADETPMAPCDVRPDEYDIAVCVDRLERATTLRVRRIERSWAGLRSFVDDHLPVVGFEPVARGFFWLAGQGGIGIMTAPAMARLAAALVLGDAVPADIRALGVDPAMLAPERFRRPTS